MAISYGLKDEIVRLTYNSSMRREELLSSALKKGSLRKVISIVAGCLALLSAGTITTVLTVYVNGRGLQLLAAITSFVSGGISLVTTAYLQDTDIASMLGGASKYLALRESVARLVLNPRLSDQDKFDALSDMQDEYAKLDDAYSKYFSPKRGPSSAPPLSQLSPSFAQEAASQQAVEGLLEKLEKL